MNFKTMFSIGLLIGLSSAAIAKLFKKDKPMTHKKEHIKVLFVLKKRDQSISWNENEYCQEKTSGLSTSVGFSSHMLEDMGYLSKVVTVQDGNFIDREIHKYNKEEGGKVTHVIVEALWLVPSKLLELKNLHKNISFSCRIHSEVPFAASEGIFTQFTLQYIKDGITVTANSKRMSDALELITGIEIPISPNYYPLERKHTHQVHQGEILVVSMSGACRILKNQLMQAMAIIHYCLKHKKILHLAINTGRKEGPTSDPLVKNLIQLMKHYEHKNFKLIELPWMNHEEFLEHAKNSNLLLQCSISETYNYVAADFITQNVPVVGSKEIPFLPKKFCADPTDIHDIIKKIDVALNAKLQGVEENFEALSEYNVYAMKEWKKFFKIK